MKKLKLGTRAVLGVVIVSVIMIATACVTIRFMYKKDLMERYTAFAYSYLVTASEYIDGDKVLQYIETNEKDEYYNNIMSFLNATQDNSELKYIYVFVPYENDLVYVWDAENEDGACELGEHESYMEGGKKASFEAFQKNPKQNINITKDDTYGYIASAYYPVFNGQGEPVALVGADISMPGIKNMIMKYTITVIVDVFVVVAIIMVFFYVYVDKRVINPINTLNEATKKLVSNIENDNEVRLNIKTGDEIEELSKSFMQMNIELKDYIKRLSKVTAEKERISAELNVATQIQANMLPTIFPPFPDKKEINIYASMKPAKEVGGDFYDFFFIDDKHLAVVIADVSGKGVPAALFMVVAKTLIKNRALMGGKPSEILSFVNNQLCENNKADMFVTVWMGILNITTGLMTATNAGHEFPAFRKKGGQFELIKDKHGFVLAGMEGTRYKDYQIQFEPGDELYVYTDGVAEATDSNNQLFGTDNMLKALNNNTNKESKMCKSAIDNVILGIHKFVADAPQFDDITMLCICYNGHENK